MRHDIRSSGYLEYGAFGPLLPRNGIRRLQAICMDLAKPQRRVSLNAPERKVGELGAATLHVDTHQRIRYYMQGRSSATRRLQVAGGQRA